jgi:hypothetical protein
MREGETAHQKLPGVDITVSIVMLSRGPVYTVLAFYECMEDAAHAANLLANETHPRKRKP